MVKTVHLKFLTEVKKMQKKIALINDVTGFGRCSIAVMAPIVSAMKIQAGVGALACYGAYSHTFSPYPVPYILL